MYSALNTHSTSKKVLKRIMPRICHNFGFTIDPLVASLSNPEFWNISLSLLMAHKAETRLAIDVLVSFNIICHWFF